jgi:hypothetical protein
MALAAEAQGEQRRLFQLSSDGVSRDLGESSVVAALHALNRLGREGWCLISTDEVSAPSFYTRTHWLRRPME